MPPVFPHPHMRQKCHALAALLQQRHWRLAAAESCTGGLLAATCTAIAGSSDWFEAGLTTYSNASKQDWLGVDAALIAEFGAVSEPVARQMADGVLVRACPNAHLAVAITGIAGPGGGSIAKPVGMVCFGFAVRDVGFMAGVAHTANAAQAARGVFVTTQNFAAVDPAVGDADAETQAAREALLREHIRARSVAFALDELIRLAGFGIR